MPEASVHKNELISAGEDNVRSARKIVAVQAKAKPHSVNEGSHDQLWGGVTLIADILRLRCSGVCTSVIGLALPLQT